MHKDTVKGAAKEAAGATKKVAGRAAGNTRVEAEGAALETKGVVQKNVGKAKSAVRDALKH